MSRVARRRLVVGTVKEVRPYRGVDEGDWELGFGAAVGSIYMLLVGLGQNSILGFFWLIFSVHTCTQGPWRGTGTGTCRMFAPRFPRLGWNYGH